MVGWGKRCGNGRRVQARDIRESVLGLRALAENTTRSHGRVYKRLMATGRPLVRCGMGRKQVSESDKTRVDAFMSIQLKQVSSSGRGLGRKRASVKPATASGMLQGFRGFGCSPADTIVK